GGYLSVSEPWIAAFHAETPDLFRQARQEATRQPDLYRQLLDEYAARQVPSVEKLARDLHLNQRYGILKEAARAAAQTFIESANYAGLLDAKGFIQSGSASQETSEDADRDVVGSGIQAA